ncbi:MAG TPA: GNAT family N-acetyltransferase [Candidatus Binatia bacterium]|nr:GNAT family N-acetyltransferase [Candidatus Binatia bacterium]
MLVIRSARLLYVPTPLEVLKQRMLRSEFVAELPANGEGPAGSALRVRFPGEWPGDDALAVLPMWVSRRERGAGAEPWTDGVMVRSEDCLAVGSIGFKGPPDPCGSVEIGYAVNRSLRGLGYASEMSAALTGWALQQPGVRRVTAQCREDNTASIRVLEKAGFARVGRRGTEDGPLLLWERDRRHSPDPGKR